MGKKTTISGWKSHMITFYCGGRSRSRGMIYSPEPEDVQTDNIMQQPPSHDQSTSAKSHARKRPAGHIPRPPNAFILFRSDFVQKNRVPASVENNHQNLSRIAGKVWRGLSDEEKKEWHARAEAEKDRHAKMYPEYQYSPTDPVTIGYRRKVKKGRSEREVRAVARRCATVANLVAKGQSGEALERAIKESELVEPVSRSPPLAPSSSGFKRHRPSSHSSLDDEDQVHSSTSTLPLSPSAGQSAFIAKTGSTTSLPRNSSNKAFPLSTPAFAKNGLTAQQKPAFSRTVPAFATALPSKVRSYGAPPIAFPPMFPGRSRQDASGSRAWSLRGTDASSDDDD